MAIPLSLYIHIPWCVQKCPYCDFNSHHINGKSKDLPEQKYISALLADLDADISRFQESRALTSIFIGGGTPSLFSGAAIARLLDRLRQRLVIDANTEITLEANPGTVDEKNFHNYYRAGVNRISIGIQSFQKQQLKKLGRIHSPDEAIRAVKTAQDVGFDNINIDLMFGLPEQTRQQALSDVEQGIALGTKHLSYYQLTLEPNTAFAHKPADELIDQRFDDACGLLHDVNFHRYEVSAWSRGRQSQHNRNYWEYGDYLGIGAGAHGKITLVALNDSVGALKNKEEIIRTVKPRSPSRYLSMACEKNQMSNIVNHKLSQPLPEFRRERIVKEAEKASELMLNTLRLMDGFSLNLIEERGLLNTSDVLPIIHQLEDKGLVFLSPNWISPTALGQRFINDMIAAFL